MVLSISRAAADLNYQCTVLANCCADADEKVQRVLLMKVFPCQAAVLTVEDWRASVSGPCQEPQTST